MAFVCQRWWSIAKNCQCHHTEETHCTLYSNNYCLSAIGSTCIIVIDHEIIWKIQHLIIFNGIICGRTNDFELILWIVISLTT